MKCTIRKTMLFNKNYGSFKKGQYIVIPPIIYSGQVRELKLWKEVKELLKKGILKYD
jgi:hypothetical protein